MFSVHCTEDGSQSTFFRATLRLRTCVRRRSVFERSQRILATELPTVPNPTRATLQFCAPSFLAPTAALLLVESRLEEPGIPSLAGKPIFTSRSIIAEAGIAAGAIACLSTKNVRENSVVAPGLRSRVELVG